MIKECKREYDQGNWVKIGRERKGMKKRGIGDKVRKCDKSGKWGKIV